MLYWILKPLVQLTTRLYFRNFQVKGKKHIPAKGPCILVANHPATFMDALLIAAHTRRKVYFLSKSTVFRSKVAAWLLPRLNMIPVYRKQDGPLLMSKNLDTFEICYRHLVHNGVLLIFPEGVSEKGRRLKPIKTGAARIALGALERGCAEVKIIGIGLNYEKNATLQTNAVMEIAPAIGVRDFLEKNKGAQQEVVRKLTACITCTLRGLTVSIEEEAADLFVSRLEEMYKPVLMDELGFDKKDKSNDFFIARQIVDHMHKVKHSDPWKLHAIKKQVDEYFGLLERYRIGEAAFRRIQNNRFFLTRFLGGIFYLFVGLPVFVYGMAVNIIPYALTAWGSRRVSVYIEFRVAISFAAGMFIYLLFYFLLLSGLHTGLFWLNLLLMASFPLSGLYAYLYASYFSNMLRKWKVFRFMYQRTDVVSVLLEKRSQIIDALERVRKEPEIFQGL